jgi:tRNA/tmRNA/rRNA uracil-C5-methylase (TrmA/RlmC/RlmD family)
MDGQSWLGQRWELRIGAVAHGGHCMARHQGRVLFVRHCLPGELVLAEVTEDRGGSYCRADAIEIREPAPDRVVPPCRYAHPGGCGGCDFQHVSPAGQRALKATVVAEQLSRLAGIDRAVTVQPLAPDDLGWRRRIRFAVDPAGRLALHRHRSSATIAIDECLIGAPGVADAPARTGTWQGLAEVEFAVDDDGRTAQVGYLRSTPRGRQRPRLRAVRTEGAEQLHYRVGGTGFAIDPAGFWQAHPQAAERFSATVLTGTAPQPGERALELYAGAGLFTAALAGAVGPSGRVLGLEGDPGSVRAAAGNLTGTGWAEVRRAPVTSDTIAAAVAELGRPDLVVLDPPRTGAGGPVLQAVLAARPRVVGYVACDPAALARDLRTAQEAGWELAELSAFDAFPMTHHVECIAMVRPRNTVG